LIVAVPTKKGSKMDKPIILIVDDEEANLQLIGKILQILEIDITLASSGKEALKLLETLIPDLIILDIVMPSMSGFDVCCKIKSIKKVSTVPIIFLSAKADSRAIIKGFKLGARDYITKPFIKEELIARVETQICTINKEKELKKLNSNLEEKVRERTKALTKTNEKLRNYNTALEVLMEKRGSDRDDIEQQVMANVDELIMPTFERIKKTSLSIQQKELLGICEENLLKLTFSFMQGIKNKSKAQGLTHKETTIANLIAQGKSSQEISTLLNSSESTINFHRNNIRKKLGIKNKPVNLHVYLKQLETHRPVGNNINGSQ
jgi:DNA-binding response OmpR family regulator/DNA-binding CsgD family transcriptional regulator